MTNPNGSEKSNDTARAVGRSPSGPRSEAPRVRRRPFDTAVGMATSRSKDVTGGVRRAATGAAEVGRRAAGAAEGAGRSTAGAAGRAASGAADAGRRATTGAADAGRRATTGAADAGRAVTGDLASTTTGVAKGTAGVAKGTAGVAKGTVGSALGTVGSALGTVGSTLRAGIGPAFSLVLTKAIILLQLLKRLALMAIEALKGLAARLREAAAKKRAGTGSGPETTSAEQDVAPADTPVGRPSHT